LDTDPHQLRNLVGESNAPDLEKYRQRQEELATCSGATCHQFTQIANDK